MKNTILLLFLGCFAVINVQNLTCSSNCIQCVNQTICTRCRAGFFVVTNFNSSTCLECPQYCSTCVQAPNGLPICTSCIPTAQLAQNGQCFICSPTCLTCDYTPTNCTSCNLGYNITINRPNNQTDYTATCVESSPISKCINWQTDAQNITYCIQCQPSHFPFLGKCVPNISPCLESMYNEQQIWDNLTRYWEPIFYSVNLTGQPDYLNNGNFSTMPWKYQGAWIAGTSFLNNYLNGKMKTKRELVNISLGFAQLIDSMQNNTQNQVYSAVVEEINSRFNSTFNTTNFQYYLQVSVFTYASCTKCPTNFYVQNNTCFNCPANCLACNASDCISCIDGYFLEGSVCNACLEPCVTCTMSATYCTECRYPASANGGKCVVCDDPCATCSSRNSSVCLTCKAPYSIVPHQGACFRCQEELCAKCLFTNTFICQQCRSTAVLVDGRCQLCPANCAQCSANQKSICFTCLQGFTLQFQGNTTSCNRCGIGCLQCDQFNSSICLKCMDGTFLNQTTTSCQKCQKNCLTCTDFTSCTQLVNGVVVFNGDIVSCREGCQICNSTSPDVCLVCLPGFYLSQNLCKSCAPGCLECQSQLICKLCMENHYLVSGICSRCVGNCFTCNSTNLTQCTSCIRGYTLVGTECLKQCGFGCLQCSSNNFTTCTQCEPGTALTQNGTCVKCLASCSGSCDSKNITICLSCADGFQLIGNQCVKCPNGCSSCLNNQCLVCLDGFELSQTQEGNYTCIQNCPSTCLACKDNQCNVCNAGYSLSNGRCIPDLSCNPNCSYCPIGTERTVNDTCNTCPTNCGSCLNGTCYQCLDGFYLNSVRQCAACPSQCLTCYDETTCNLCKPGYVKQILSLGPNGIQDAVLGDQCIACDKNCLTCQIYPNQCTSCPIETRLIRSNCIGMFNIVYNYVLNVDYNKFLNNSQIQIFFDAITRITGVSPADHYINSIQRGSARITGTISTPNQEAASNVQQKLQNNNQVGFPVLSSSSNIYYGDSLYTTPPPPPGPSGPTQNQGNGPNVPLILGLSIGLGGAALIGLIILACYIIYRKKNKNKPVPRKDQQSQNQMRTN